MPEKELHTLPNVALRSAIAVGLLTTGAVIATAESAHAADTHPETPQAQTYTVTPGDSAWSMYEKYTDETPQQIKNDLPLFYQQNHKPQGGTIFTDEKVALPQVQGDTTVIPYGTALWTVVSEHDGKPPSAARLDQVAQASQFSDREHYLANSVVVIPPEGSNMADQTNTIPPQHPEQHATPPAPETTKDTAQWQAEPGPAILNIAAIVGGINNVPAGTAAAWIRDANPGVDLSKLTKADQLKLPGVTQEQWDNVQANFGKFIAVKAMQAAAEQQAAAPGLEHPLNSAALAQNYYRLPDALEYAFQTPDTNVRAGSKALVDGLYTVGKRWYALHPESKLDFGDLNAGSGHASHKNGVDADITTVDKQAANIYGDREKSVELAKMLADTGITDVIFYNDAAVQQAFNSYVKEKGLPGRMESWPNHDNHMHWRVLPKFRLNTSLGSPPELPPPAPSPEVQPPIVVPLTPEVASPTTYTADTSILSKSGLDADQFEQLLVKYAPAMAGKNLGPVLVEMEQKYSINGKFIIADAKSETDAGAGPLAAAKKNLFGRNHYSSNPGAAITSTDFADSIREFSAFVSYYYLTPPSPQPLPEIVSQWSHWKQSDTPGMHWGGGTSIRQFMQHYDPNTPSDAHHADKHAELVAEIMNGYRL